MNLRGRTVAAPRLLASALLLAALAFAAACAADDDAEQESLKIGLLLDTGEGVAEASMVRQQGFDLAIRHINDAGGVLGRPVTYVLADPTSDPDTAVEVARRLVEVEGVHALVGPSSSANSIPVAEQVARPAGIPMISPSATSPMLTTADDGDFFFRTALSDIAQGPVLARLTRERGFERVGVVYRDDAWGRGLYETFAAAWDGDITAVAIQPEAETYLPELRTTGDGEALVVITFADEAETILREALDSGLYDQFVFGDAARRLALVQVIGGDRLGGMYGTAGVARPNTESQAAWDEAYREAYGELPVTPYVRETYDAAIAIALAAEAAGSLHGGAIRDHLRWVGAAPGEVVIAGPDGVARALDLLAGGSEVDYQGAAVTLDWDANGDLLHGHIGIWRFTADERIEDLDAVAYGE
ncbi:MAG: ABC transporter substrate-binding protein [Chloroflexota bacterium]|nr:ABC transporter substrate-binding protein [Chloroflexota bacterium]